MRNRATEPVLELERLQRAWRLYLRTSGLHNHHRMNVNLPGRVASNKFALPNSERMFNNSQPIRCQLLPSPQGRDPVQGFAFPYLFSMRQQCRPEL